MKRLSKTTRSIEDRIRPVGDIEKQLAVFAYGDQKTGKTIFGCTFPKPLLLIDINEKGEDSVIDVKGVDVLRVTEWNDIEDIYWHLEGGTKYKSIVLDQCTAMQALAIDKIKRNKGQKPSDVFSQRSYGQLGGLMTQQLLDFRNLVEKGYHVCFNAHQKKVLSSDEDDDRIAPEVTGALTASIVGFLLGAVSVIGNTFIREERNKKEKTSEFQYCMRLVSSYYRCGIRRPISAGPAPEYIVNPTFEKILKLSKGESLARKVRRA